MVQKLHGLGQIPSNVWQSELLRQPLSPCQQAHSKATVQLSLLHLSKRKIKGKYETPADHLSSEINTSFRIPNASVFKSYLRREIETNAQRNIASAPDCLYWMSRWEGGSKVRCVMVRRQMGWCSFPQT